MKKFITLLLGLLCFMGFSQEDQTAPRWDVTRPNSKTTAQMNSMTRMVEGSEVWNTDTNTYWRYVSGAWIDTGLNTGSDGVISNVALNALSLDFTGADGGFNGSVDLSSLQDGTGTDDQTAAEVGFTPYSTNTATDVQDAIQQNVDDINGLVFYEGESTVSNGLSSVNLTLSNSRTTFTSSATAVTTNLTTASTNIGSPFLLHLISTNASGTTFTFPATVEDQNGNAGFDVTLAQNEELTLHFIVYDANVTRCVNYPVSSGGGPSYTAPENFSISFGTTVLTDLNIHQGTAKTINVMNAANTANIELIDVNTDEIDVFDFNVDGPGTMEFTSANGFLSSQIGSNTAVRVSSEGAVTFEETGVNTGVFRIYPGDNVTYFTPDTTAPLYSSSEVGNVDDTSLVITYNEPLDTGSVPATTDFSVNDGAANAVTNVAVLANTVDLTLTNAIQNGDVVTVSYTAGSNPIQDVAGNDAVNLVTESVTNNVAPSCTPDANEQHTQANAASDPNCNEANATTGWSSTGGTLSSVTDPQTGTYALSHVSGDGSSDRMEYDLAVTNGDTFTVTFWAKGDTGSRLSVWTNVSGGPNGVPVTSSYVEYTYNITATATGTAVLRFYSALSGSAGEEIFIDNLSIVKTN